MYGKTRNDNTKSVKVGSLGEIVPYASMAEAAVAGRLFSVANQGPVTTTDGLATTWTGLCVGNPAASGKLYRFWEFGWSQDIASNTEGSIGLMACAQTGATMAQTLTPQCARFGHATSQALADSAATIGTPILLRLCGSNMEGAISTVPSLGPNIYNIGGSIVIEPGDALLTYTNAIQTVSFIYHFVWEEITEASVDSL